MTPTYADGARFGMCIGQIKEDWRHEGKKIVPDQVVGGKEVKGNVDEFIEDVLFFHAVVCKTETRLNGIGKPEPKPSGLNFRHD